MLGTGGFILNQIIYQVHTNPQSIVVAGWAKRLFGNI
jgi:hypothetical protein